MAAFKVSICASMIRSNRHHSNGIVAKAVLRVAAGSRGIRPAAARMFATAADAVAESATPPSLTSTSALKDPEAFQKFMSLIDSRRSNKAYQFYTILEQNGDVTRLSAPAFRSVLELVKLNTVLPSRDDKTRLEVTERLWTHYHASAAKPDEGVYKLFLYLYGRLNSLSGVDKTIEAAKRAGLKLDDAAVQTKRVQCLAFEGKFEEARAVLAKLKSERRDVILKASNAYMFGLSAGGHEEEMLQTFERYLEDGIDLKDSYFHILSYYAAKADTDKLAEWLDFRREQDPRPLNGPLFNILINAYNRAGKPEEAAQLVAEMQAANVPPNARSAAYVAETAATQQDAVAAWQASKAYTPHSIRTLVHRLARGVATATPQHIFTLPPDETITELKTILKKADVEYTERTLRLLLRGFRTLKNGALAEKVLALYPASAFKPAYKPHKIVFDTYIAAEDLPNALRILALIREGKWPVTAADRVSVLRVMVKQGRMDEAHEFWAKVQAETRGRVEMRVAVGRLREEFAGVEFVEGVWRDVGGGESV
ncbi:uncharacterized protein EV422DRAFT_616677 [Fimicolochytrium jonesii]|uniref:uncharacterized protein n=1 Tax=Fimicolochytrium jonesii TaxID=1396493 RepID=UPI0022FEB110|nr:uncharacterized protein EV422DRAFT_616677 [Fimicolochytrium jonesii]KAI8825590.1 hypothetical protein EV422DRAFT_616677 [Fimicolochytrium jonesii]